MRMWMKAQLVENDVNFALSDITLCAQIEYLTETIYGIKPYTAKTRIKDRKDKTDLYGETHRYTIFETEAEIDEKIPQQELARLYLELSDFFKTKLVIFR